MPENDHDRVDESKTLSALVRIHEANCRLDFATDLETNFRGAIMKKLGICLKLPEMRAVEVTGPGKAMRRPAPAGGAEGRR